MYCDCLDLSVLFTIVISVLFYPLLTPPKLVRLDDMQEWGLKGPGTASLSPNMRGIYYFSGNQRPSKCNATELRDPVICRNGFHRSEIFGMDTSYCARTDSRTMVCSGPFFLVSAHEKHHGYTTARVLPLTRLSYTFDKTDPEFIHRSEDAFDGAMTLRMFGLPISTLFGHSHRTTSVDQGGGKRIRRYTWWNSSNTPQPTREADRAWTYDMVRVMDERGKINRAVLAQMKKSYGELAWRM